MGSIKSASTRASSVAVAVIVLSRMSKSCWIILCVTSLAAANPAFDSYQDSLNKYSQWHKKFGLGEVKRNRFERNVVNQAIFVPHRPKDGGKQFVSSNLNILNVPFESDSELAGPNIFRNTRQPLKNFQFGLGGEEYLSNGGTPLYKLKKRYPLGYGRRKRDTRQQYNPCNLLDPATGRPVKCDIDKEDNFYAALDSQGSGRLRPSRGNPHDRSTFYYPYVDEKN